MVAAHSSAIASNPFLDHTFLIRWADHTPDRVVSAIESAIAEAQAAIDAVAGDPSPATFENTFLALERATERLGYAWGKVTHLQAVADGTALREAHNAVLPAVSAFYAKIPLNPALWARLKAGAASESGRAVTGVWARLRDETVASFTEAGADLPAEQRARLEALEGELAQLTQKYSENTLDSTNAWQLLVEDEARLRGLPAHAIAAARDSARKKGLGSDEKPVWRFTLHGPSQEPVMLYAEDESLRRELWQAAVQVGGEAEGGKWDNGPLVQKILALRAEKAAILGKANFADLVLTRRMARNGARALEFVLDFETRCRAAFAKECAELEEFKAQRTGQASGRLKAWEVGYWAEKLRQARHAFDEEELRPYFEVGRVQAGLFELATRVFGLRIAERAVGREEVWHEDVKFYDLFEAASGRHLGSFYADWHPRESKRGGAWMGYLVTGEPASAPGAPRGPHLGYICGNMTPPSPENPALLTHREVETIFHEFGHLLHHLLGEVPVKSLNGVNVAWDFVELPSQIMENWCWERESLDLFARHYKTNTPIPGELFNKMIGARNFRSATAAMRQVQFAKMDLLLHVRAGEFVDGDLEAKTRALVADTMIPTEPPARTIVRRFGHLFSDPVGYAAGYYSYKWAEVLEADAFTRWKQAGVFSRAVGAEFVEHILSRGNSEDAAVLFRRFMGRDADPRALLERCGLAG
ncbi:MAG: M3 family metallopeptidase [Opitutaceae bacterium]|jgi:oligopeptidase A|nr:M3 family metallopeptidase [Opitutaceae bacterium]